MTLKKPSTSLELRPVESCDLDSYFAWQADPEASYMAAFMSRDPSDRAAFDAHWQKILADTSVLMRTIVSDGNVVGSVGSFVMFEKKQVSYWIDKAHWGKGLATAALRIFLQEVLERPIYGCAARDNSGSIRVLEKCGFKLDSYSKGYAGARKAEIEEAIMRLD